jgi:hypothetical protein
VNIYVRENYGLRDHGQQSEGDDDVVTIYGERLIAGIKELQVPYKPEDK